MPSITLMMSTILCELSLIDPMVSTTWLTTSPPLTAKSDAEITSWFACLAFSAFCLTVIVNSLIEETVSCREFACDSVRDEISALPEAIWLDVATMASVPTRTWPTIFSRLSFMPFSACSNCPVSSCAFTTMWLVRSPAATVLATWTAWIRGAKMFRIKKNASTAASTTAISPPPMSRVLVKFRSVATSAERCARDFASASLISARIARMFFIDLSPRPPCSNCTSDSIWMTPAVMPRRIFNTGSIACFNHFCSSSSNFCKRSCCWGLSAVSDFAFSTPLLNVSFPIRMVSRNSSCPVRAKPRSPVCMLTRLVSMPWAWSRVS